MTITLEVAATILSIVSFIVTVFGFFASLKFYRDGVELQKAANDALAKMSEKTEFIQLQAGGMFDKTLDAALGQPHKLNSSFEELEKQLAATKEALMKEVRGQIGEVGDQQQQRIKQVVEEQIRLLTEKVESTKESAEEVAETTIEHRNSVPALRFVLLRILAASDKPISLSELGQLIKMQNPLLNVSNLARRVRELVMGGAVVQIEEGATRKYYVSEYGRNLIHQSGGAS